METRSLEIVGNQITCGKGFEEEGRVVNIVYTQNASDTKEKITMVYLKKPLEGGIDAPSCADELTPQMVSDGARRLIARIKSFEAKQLHTGDQDPRFTHAGEALH